MLGWLGLVMICSVFAAGAVFLLAELLGFDAVATAAGYAMVPATVFFLVLLILVVAGAVAGGATTAVLALLCAPVRAWRRRRRG